MYMDKGLIKGKLYQIINPFDDGNGRTCKIIFANNDIIRQNT